MAFHTFKDYISSKRKEGESYLKFYNRVLKPKFGLVQRNSYELREDEDVYVNTSRNGDKILREIKGNL